MTDPEKIDSLKGNAVRALTNYLMMESSIKDPKLKDRAQKLRQQDIDVLRKRGS